MSNEELVIKIKAGENELIPALWEQIEKFIRLMANKFYTVHINRCISVGVELNDLYQLGYFAMLNAIKAYDDSAEYQFTTYLSKHLKNIFFKAAEMRSTGWQNKPDSVSLDAAIYEDDNGAGVSLLDSIPDPTAEADLDNIIETDYKTRLHDDLIAAMSDLPDEQRRLIDCLYFRNLSYKEAGRVIGRQYINRVHDTALKNMARHERLQVYKADIIERYGRRCSFRKWKETGMSPQEKVIIELEKRGLL